MPRDKEALKSGLTSYMRSLQQCLAKVRTFFRAPQSDMLPDITMLRISAQVSRDKADRKPDNLFKNSTAEPLKGGVNVCIRLRSSSSAIRLSPSQIRACGFPAPGSSRG